MFTSFRTPRRFRWWRESRMGRAAGKHGRALVFLLLLLLTLTVYFRSLFAFFHHDDFFLLRFVFSDSLCDLFRIAHIEPVESLPANIPWLFRPIPHYIFFYLSRSLFGLDPLPYHVIQLAAVAGISFLIYVLATRLYGGASYSLLPAILFLLAVRVNFESVFWISGMVELSVTLLVLLALVSFISLDSQTSHHWLYASIASISYLGALFCKESAIVLPLVLLLDYDSTHGMERSLSGDVSSAV